MTVQITARRCEVSDAVKEQARSMAARWPRFEPVATGVSFVFEVEGRVHTAEAIVSRKRLPPVVATGGGDDFRKALDDLDAHIRRILRRDHQRRKEHRIEPTDLGS